MFSNVRCRGVRLLIQMMANQSNTSTQDKQSIQSSHLEILFRLLSRKSTAIPQQIHKTDSNTSIDIQNEIVLLAGSNSFDGKSVIEEFSRWEGIVNVLLDQFDT